MLKDERRPKKTRRLPRRILAFGAKALAALLLFAVAIVATALLVSGTPTGQRFIATQLNRALSDSFRGTVTLGGLRRLRLDGVDDANILVRDGDERVVLVADGITVRLALAPLARALIAGKGDIPIQLTTSHVRSVEAILIPGSDGQPTIAHAFDPRPPAAPSAPSSRGIQLVLRDARIDRVWAHGAVGPFEELDAVVSELKAAVLYDASATVADIQPFDLDVHGVLPQARSLTGKVEAHLRMPEKGLRSGSVSFDGGAGDIGVGLRAALRGDAVDATLKAIAGGGAIDAKATGSIRETKTADVTVSIDGVDPHRIVESAPETTVRAKAHLRARVGSDDAVWGDAEMQTQPMRLKAQTLPPISLRSQFTANHAVGHVHANEPGAPIDVDFVFDRSRGRETVEVEAHARALDLSRVELARGQDLQGAADAHASGHVDLSRGTVDAETDVQLAGLHRGDDSARFAVVRASAHGRFDAAALSATVHAVDVRASGRAIERVEVDASGTPQRVSLAALVRSQGLDLRGGGTLTFGEGITADGVVVDATRGGTRATASLDRLHAEGDTIEVAGMNITGLGAPIGGEAQFSPRAIALRVDAPAIDPERVTALLGRDDVHLRGATWIDVDVRATRQSATGHVKGEFHSTSVRNVKESDVRVDLSLAGRHVDGEANVAFDDARADVRLSGVLVGGPPTEIASWRRATGAVDVDSSVDLATICGAAPQGLLPFEQMAGRLDFKAHVARGKPDAEPDATLEASTTGLVLVSEPAASEKPSYVDTPEQAEPPALPWETRGVDLHFKSSLEGASKRFAFDGSLRDSGGALLDLELETRAPLGDAGHVTEMMEHAPITLHAVVPPREVSRLPPAVRPAALRGLLSGTLDVKGTVNDPRIAMHVETEALQPMSSKSAVPLDGTIDATYDGRTADVKAHVTRARRPDDVVVEAHASADAREADFIVAREGEVPWDARANVALRGFPLEAIPQVAARHVGGLASGTVVLEGLHRDGTLDANLTFSKASLGGEVFDTGVVRARLDHEGLNVSTRFDKVGSSVAATLKGKTRWGADLSPSLEEHQAVDATLEAHAFRAAALMPLLQGAVHQLDGRIDAKASVHVQPDFKDGTMDGDVVLHGGRFDMPEIGGSFHDVGARVTIRPWGTLRVDDITARGVEGKLKASATAKLEGMNVRSATLVADIARRERIPLTVGGISLGEASGHIQVDAAMSSAGDALTATVDIPNFEMDLPQSTGHAVEALEPAKDVVVGMHEPSGRVVVLPLHAPDKARSPDSMKVKVVVHLGNDVWIKRDTSLAVRLTGSPVLDLGQAARVTGTIGVTSGKLEVFGKRFEIQPDSTVSFTGETDNPQLVVTALYDAPDKTKIYADVVGPLRHLNVKLRSDSGQSQDELLSLLLFGSEEGIGGTPPPSEQPDSTQRAAGLAGGVVTQGINKALSGITSLDIATRLDTSDAANPKPEVEVRVSNDVVTRVTVNTGMPAPGESPDRTLLSVDWTFKPRWLLETTMGDEGSTFFDVLWRHRY
jgi:translocation and assembly module TamB